MPIRAAPRRVSTIAKAISAERVMGKGRSKKDELRIVVGVKDELVVCGADDEAGNVFVSLGVGIVSFHA